MENSILAGLYHKYRRELYLYLYSLCHNHVLAEDILQETFCKAMLFLSNEHSNMRAWLYLVSRNLLLNEIKKNKREVLFNEIDHGSTERQDALDHMLTSDRNKILYQALSSLEIRKREILVLRYFGMFTLKEVAKMLQISYENARVLSLRARREVKRYMEVNDYEL